ncbi:MAG: TetR/AcrR family transcriptional regulator C-terminal domain-containing protein [Deltaproteobacteria bacterium]|nr:TetR/AcrR family transcriptional regulator C-terminal domain-containing protein [Deltaproteobacteria bacterium]
MSKRRPLDRETILDAAIDLLDRHGFEGLSMRKLATVLGVEAMSLYNHVDGKGALLDGIHERILVSLDAPPTTRSWQAFVRHQAFALDRALRAHPHAIPLFATRPAATPAAIERLGKFLEILERAGFTPMQALSIVQLVAQLVTGHAMWTTSLESGLVPDAPPAVVERKDPDRELVMGIDALLAGFAQLLR